MFIWLSLHNCWRFCQQAGVRWIPNWDLETWRMIFAEGSDRSPFEKKYWLPHLNLIHRLRPPGKVFPPLPLLCYCLGMLGQTFLFVAYALSSLLVSRADSGCGSMPSWSFDSHGHANRTMGDRSFYVHLPESYDTNVPHPLVLSFHAFDNSEAYQERISGFSQDGLEIDGKVRVWFCTPNLTHWFNGIRGLLLYTREEHMAQEMLLHGRVPRMQRFVYFSIMYPADREFSQQPGVDDVNKFIAFMR